MVEMSSPRPRLCSSSRASLLATSSHLQPGWKEVLGWKWSALKHVVPRFYRRWMWFVTLPNIAGIVLLTFAILYAHRGAPDVTTWLADNTGLVTVQQDLDSFVAMERRMAAMRDEQQRQKKITEQTLLAMEHHIYEKVNSVRQEMKLQMEEILANIEHGNKTVGTLSEQEINSTREQLEKVESRLNQKMAEINDVVEKMEETVKQVSELTILKTPALSRNLASYAEGACVIANQSSPQYVVGSWVHKAYATLWESNTLQWPIVDRSVMVGGEAFCFSGTEGNLTIRLSSASPVAAVQYEHSHWSRVTPPSAPRVYVVMICTDEDCEKWSHHAHCSYGEPGPVAQQCVFETPSPVTDRIRLRVLSNHGQTYTCIYNVKVLAPE